jgi:hypothetical protein
MIRKLSLLSALLPLAFALVLVASCASRGSAEISKERAIEIARQHVDFEPGRIEAEAVTEEGRPVWRVTFYGKGVTPTHPGEVMIVTVDRRTGEMVTLAMS